MNLTVGISQKEFDERLKSVDYRSFLFGLLTLTVFEFYEKKGGKK